MVIPPRPLKRATPNVCSRRRPQPPIMTSISFATFSTVVAGLRLWFRLLFAEQAGLRVPLRNSKQLFNLGRAMARCPRGPSKTLRGTDRRCWRSSSWEESRTGLLYN